jgi:gliding motility-associated-like protein
MTTSLFAQKKWSKIELSTSKFIEDVGQCGDFEKENNVDVKYMMYGRGVVYYITKNEIIVQQRRVDHQAYKEGEEKVEERMRALVGLSHNEKESLEHEEFKKLYQSSIREQVLRCKIEGGGLSLDENADPTLAKYHFNDSDGLQLAVNAGEVGALVFSSPSSELSMVLSAYRGGIKYELAASNKSELDALHLVWDKATDIRILENGGLEINNQTVHLTDKRPTASNIKGELVDVKFRVSGTGVGFEAKWDSPEIPIVIDPWVISIDSNVSQGLNVESDADFNAYVYVNDLYNPLDYIKKFDPDGNLIWANVFAAASYTDGDIEIDDQTGDIFTSSISVTGKYDVDGVSLWANSFYEAWSLEFNCTEHQFVGGGNFGPNGSKLHNLDPETGSALSVFLQPNDSTAAYNEVRAATSSSTGDYYFLTLGNLIKVCPALQVDYQLPNLHDSLPYFGPLYHNLGAGNPWGEYNGIAVDSQYLYTYDGRKLIQRIAASGVVVDSIILSNGSRLYNDGILVDACGYIYAGAQSQVYKLDNTLSLIDSVGGLAEVYDLAFADSGLLYVTGNDYLATIFIDHCGEQACQPADTLPYTFSADTVVCAGDSIQLSASGGSSYFWFPNYNISDVDTSHVFVAPDVSTTYGVVIKFDSCYFRIGYVRVYVDTLTVYNLPPDTTICEGDEVTITVTGTADTFAIASIDLSYIDTGSTFMLKPDSSMTYKIASLGLDSSGCGASYFVGVLPKPKEIPLGPLFQCENSSIQIEIDSVEAVGWSPIEFVDPDSGLIVNVQMVDSGYIFLNSRKYGICVWEDSIFINVGAKPDMQLPFHQTNLCEGTILRLNLEGADLYAWAPDTFLSDDSIPNPKINPDSTITYTITGINQNGCKVTDTMRIDIKPNSQARILMQDTVVCRDDVLEFGIYGKGDLKLSPLQELTRIDSNRYSYLAKSSIEFVLTSILNGFCADTDRLQINVPEFPEIISKDTTICRGDEAIIVISVFQDVDWYPSFGMRYLGDGHYGFAPNVDMDYTMISKDGCDDNDSIRIRVIDCGYFVSNVISPNADGINDVFKLDSKIFIKSLGNIYNRWGQLVYSGDLTKFGWDGSVNGQTVSAGTYFFIIDGTNIYGEEKQMRGNLNVLR